MKKTVKITGFILVSLATLFILFLTYLTIFEYRPDDKEEIAVSEEGKSISQDDMLTILTYNIGYGALSKDADFFMDGGKRVQPKSKELIHDNMAGILRILKENLTDIVLIQEIDLASKRTWFIDQKSYFEEHMNRKGVFAYNFNSKYVPYPLPTIGKVESGLLTLTDRKIDAATRISLPSPFSWPVSTCNLKRCLLESRFSINDSDKELVVFNLHLEAYDDGEGKVEQTRILMDQLKAEYEKGNYVIAGGDFNQTFDSVEGFPIFNKDDWVPGKMEESNLPEGFSFAVSDDFATCRLLNAPYQGNYEKSQVFVIDGFIVSANIEVESIQVIDTQFEFSDHQPVRLSFRLQ